MAMKTSCPTCGRGYELANENLGRKARCDKCNAVFRIASGKGLLLTSGRQSPASTGLEQEDMLLQDFVVEGSLGEGGMGTVWLVRSTSSGQRFALKRLRLRSEESRRNFLSELQTWMDLPACPHLTACRFFRTIGQEVGIFAEYVEGGSLAAWISQLTLS